MPTIFTKNSSRQQANACKTQKINSLAHYTPRQINRELKLIQNKPTKNELILNLHSPMETHNKPLCSPKPGNTWLGTSSKNRNSLIEPSSTINITTNSMQYKYCANKLSEKKGTTVLKQSATQNMSGSNSKMKPTNKILSPKSKVCSYSKAHLKSSMDMNNKQCNATQKDKHLYMQFFTQRNSIVSDRNSSIKYEMTTCTRYPSKENLLQTKTEYNAGQYTERKVINDNQLNDLKNKLVRVFKNLNFENHQSKLKISILQDEISFLKDRLRQYEEV